MLHLASTGSARILISGDTDNVTETDVAQLQLTQDGGLSTAYWGMDGNTANDMVFAANSTTLPAIRFELGSTGTTFGGTVMMTILNGGNVGIGTTGPLENFHVYDNAGDSFGLFEAFISGETAATKYKNNAGTAIFGLNGNPATQLISGADGLNYSAVMVSPSGQAIQFAPANAVAMTLSSNGNVGIGTTNPSQKLQIIGSGTGTNSTVKISLDAGVSCFGFIQTAGVVTISGTFSCN